MTPARRKDTETLLEPLDVCDEVATELPRLGRELASALDAVVDATVLAVSAAQRHDAFVISVTPRLHAAWSLSGGDGPRAQAQPQPRRGAIAASPFVGDCAAPAEEPTETSPRRRLSIGHSSAPTVDGMPVTSCRGASQLAVAVLPALRHLGASEGFLEGLKRLAAEARPLPGGPR